MIVPWYNLTAVNTSNLLTITQDVNRLFMQNMFGTMILVVLFIIAYQSFSMFWGDINLNLAASMFLVAVLSIFFRILNLVFDQVPWICWFLYAFVMLLWILSLRE